MPDYAQLTQTLDALCHGETDSVALMATITCELHRAHELADWTGFYRVTAPQTLKIGPYQGGHGCLVIPFSRGVCGAAARTGQPQLVPDVNAFPGHIACVSSTRSELVLPVWNGEGILLGVLDLDSNSPDAFNETDVRELTALLARLFQHAC
ncbi:GAF domain-containing protein [Pseudorhodobacter sp.]|uniref:GAF domain-containing protein n=1 Tax=Pseudorhodobacter sp. TaxID=1934400 RepID=UPI002647D246|nr:GAF domain-containing protein [Pseudorhodobacter sp.]MDN5785822.1 GAF domain-containing protein [Pseudorhodobacter sp.]